MRGGDALEVLVSSSSESASGSGCPTVVLFFTAWVSVRCSATYETSGMHKQERRARAPDGLCTSTAVPSCTERRVISLIESR